MDNTKNPTVTWKNENVTMTFTWYPGNDINKFHPYTQVYGVVFDIDGKMLIQRRETRPWCLAGGTVEEGESAEETLRRELIEEADVTIKTPTLLGGQRVQFPGGHNPNPTKRFECDDFYQLRYYCEIDEILPQTPDPDHNIVNERLFVPQSEINNYLNWGETGQAIFDQAIALWQKLHPLS